MSIPVDVLNLEPALAGYGAGYLLTTGADGRVKAVTVETEVVDGVLVLGAPGRGSTANIERVGSVTLLFPPLLEHGYTLLIDGTATLRGDQAYVSATSAVLHRPAAHADGPPPPSGLGGSGPSRCGEDCRPV